jgi:hypothetical protein
MRAAANQSGKPAGAVPRCIDLQRDGQPVQSLHLSVGPMLTIVAALCQGKTSLQSFHFVALRCKGLGGVCNDAMTLARTRLSWPSWGEGGETRRRNAIQVTAGPLPGLANRPMSWRAECAPGHRPQKKNDYIPPDPTTTVGYRARRARTGMSNTRVDVFIHRSWATKEALGVQALQEFALRQVAPAGDQDVGAPSYAAGALQKVTGSRRLAGPRASARPRGLHWPSVSATAYPPHRRHFRPLPGCAAAATAPAADP